MKQCLKCNQSKPRTEFGKDAATADQLRRWCRTCSNENGRAAWKKHPSYHARLHKRYGMSETQYEYILMAQHGKCLICDATPERLVVDHDHATGEVRGLICRFCNFMLGNSKECTAVLEAGARYLRAWEKVQRGLAA
jgi:hypothetical protein